jgi:hypothetical protein
MKFGIFNIGDYHPQSSKPIPDYYEDMLEQVEWAEKLGYESFWFGEHHFDFFGVVPAPPVMMARPRSARLKSASASPSRCCPTTTRSPWRKSTRWSIS